MAPSHWAAYVNEMLPGKVTFIEKEWGFVSYSLQGDSVYIEDLYVVPAERNPSKLYELIKAAEEAGHLAGKVATLCSVRVDSPRCADNLRMHLALGAVPVSAESGTIYLKRKIEGAGK